MNLKFLPTLTLALSLMLGSLFAVDPQAPIQPSDDEAPIRVACVGDSITWAGGPKKGHDYPTQLQAMLGDQWEVKNFGCSGHTLMKKGDRPYWNNPFYAKSLNFKPDVVIIMLGTNDAKPHNWKHRTDFVGDYKALIQSYQELETNPRIYICRPCPVFGQGNFRIKPENVAEQVPLVEALAKELEIGLIDMRGPLEGHPELVPDTVHPIKAGHTKLAESAYEVLTGKAAP
jgi:lysophospholipase L1-like esterase